MFLIDKIQKGVEFTFSESTLEPTPLYKPDGGIEAVPIIDGGHVGPETVVSGLHNFYFDSANLQKKCDTKKFIFSFF